MAAGEPADCDEGYFATAQPTSWNDCPNYRCLPAPGAEPAMEPSEMNEDDGFVAVWACAEPGMDPQEDPPYEDEAAAAAETAAGIDMVLSVAQQMCAKISLGLL